MKMRLNPGLNGDSNDAQRNQRCQQSHTNINENPFEPQLNGGSNEGQRNQRCQQSHTNLNENAFEPFFNVEMPCASCLGRAQTARVYSDMCRRHGGPRDKEARQSERQSVRTTTTHPQWIEHVNMTKQSDSKHFFPDWIGQCEKISWNHILVDESNDFG